MAPSDWQALLAGQDPGGAPGILYGPLLGGSWVLGRIAQSLDGRIATCNGRSQWISGKPDIVHTHRLRALCDAIVVGAGTVAADDPQLTTRLVDGRSPVRVIIDPACRLGPHHRVFTDGPRTLIACLPDAGGAGPVERITVPGQDGTIDAGFLIDQLGRRGLSRVFIEGGGRTVSHFLRSGRLDRLHVTVAPLILGSGIPAFTLPEIAAPDDGIRAAWRCFPLGQDMLFDMALR